MVLIAFSAIARRPNPAVCSFVQFCELGIHLSHSIVNLKKTKNKKKKHNLSVRIVLSSGEGGGFGGDLNLEIASQL